MKKLTRKPAIVLFFVVFTFMGISAQTTPMEDYTWDTYKIKFKIPTSFTVGESDDTQFSASNSNMTLAIYPRRAEDLYFNGYKTALENWVTSSSIITSSDYLKVTPTTVNGFVGAMVDGTKNGKPVFLMVVANPKDLDVSLYVWISYPSENLSIAEDILHSIAPME